MGNDALTILKSKIYERAQTKYINGKLSIVDVVGYLEPFLIYTDDLTYNQYKEIVEFIDSKISESNGTYSFTTTTIFEINRGSIIDTYELVSTGNLIMVDRNFPNNPHGLLITNYFENTLKKLNDEGRKK